MDGQSLQQLTPETVRKAVESVKHNANSFSPHFVDQVFRYGAPVGSQIQYINNAARCMDVAKQQIISTEEQDKSFATGTVYIADELSASKGRFDRRWHAPAGGIWMALALVNTLLPESTALYSLAAGVACCEAVRSFNIPAHIKWVNDVRVHDLKVAGILIETMRGPRYGEEYILIGIGLNVNNKKFPEELSGIATAMAAHGPFFYLPEVGAQLIARLAWNIGLLHYEEDKRLAKEGSDHPLITSWHALSDTIGRRVNFGSNVMEQPLYSAVVKDVDQNGRLIMELDDGRTVSENAGEIEYL